MKKKHTRHTPNAGNGGSKNSAAPDQRLESAVDQLLEAGEGRGDDSAPQAGSPAGRNGAGKTKEQEIEALLERMIFSERAFIEYSH